MEKWQNWTFSGLLGQWLFSSHVWICQSTSWPYCTLGHSPQVLQVGYRLLFCHLDQVMKVADECYAWFCDSFFKRSVYSSIVMSRSTHAPNCNCIGHRLHLRLQIYVTLLVHVVRPGSYAVGLWICIFDEACHSWTEMFLCHSIKISTSLESWTP